MQIRHYFLAVFITIGLTFSLKAQFTNLVYPFKVQTLDIQDSITIAYTEQGKSKPVLLFVHGLGSYAPAWQHNLPDLAKDYRCIAIDLPGYGKSSIGDYPAGMSFYAQCIADFCQAKKLKKIVLVGHSMGGQIALTTAKQFPKLVKKLVLVAPAGLETFSETEGQLIKNFTSPSLVAVSNEAQIRQNFAQNFFEMPETAEQMIKDRLAMKEAGETFTKYCQVVSRNVAAMLAEPVMEALPSIEQPALVLLPQEDQLIPNKILHAALKREEIAQNARKMPNAQVVWVEKAGHMAQFEQAEAVNQAIRNFLK